MWGPHACAVMPWGGGDCTLGLAWEVAIMMPLQYTVYTIAANSHQLALIFCVFH
jgi:hypothetical protein